MEYGPVGWEIAKGNSYQFSPPLPYIAGPAFAAYDLWSASPPAGPAAPPNPRVLAQQAVASMQLRAITIGLVPEPQPGSVGLVGIPNWMWVDAPSATTWGPITRSASAAGFTVTATAQVQQVDWNMGDGQVVSCCLLYTSDAADARSSVDLGGRRIVKKNKNKRKKRLSAH